MTNLRKSIQAILLGDSVSRVIHRLVEGKAISISPEMEEMAEEVAEDVISYLKDFKGSPKKAIELLNRKIKKIEVYGGDELEMGIVKTHFSHNKLKLSAYKKSYLKNPHLDIQASLKRGEGTKDSRWTIEIKLGTIFLKSLPLTPIIARLAKDRIRTGLMHEMVHRVDPKVSYTFSKSKIKEYGNDTPFKDYLADLPEQEAFFRLGSIELVDTVYAAMNKSYKDSKAALRETRKLLVRLNSPELRNILKKAGRRGETVDHAYSLIDHLAVFPRGSNNRKRFLNTINDEYQKLIKRVSRRQTLLRSLD